MAAVGESPTSEEALLLQAATFAGNEPASSLLEVRSLGADGRPGPREFIPVNDLSRVVETVLALVDVNVYVGAAPRVRESGTSRDVERVHCLWADCDKAEAVEALRRFRPMPSIVAWTSPGRAQALWPLRRPVTPAAARRANRRIAHALGADMAATDPARILRAIGSRNFKHNPPAPVTCARLELDVYTLGEVVGSLPDAPGEPPRRMIIRACAPFHKRVGSDSGSGSLGALVRTVREAPVGERNALLYWAACRAQDEGHDAREELRDAAL
jgi:hypothetical protein